MDSLRDNIKHAAGMATKEEAHYTNKGTPQAHCAMCQHYQHGYTCDKVQGKIFPGGWCRFFSKRAA